MQTQAAVLVLVPDLFFRAKIAATAEATGASVRVIASGQELVQECRAQPGAIVVLDLKASGIDPIGLIRSFKQAADTSGPRFVGFYSHVDKELERRAREAGCDLVLPKSIFSKRLPEILTGALPIG